MSDPVPLPVADARVTRAADGDRAAFEALYREHVDRVRALCLRLSGDPARADELTQRTFVKAWRGLGRFRGDAAFGTWLHRIAVRVVLDQDRSAWWRRVRSALPADDRRPDPTPADPGRRVDLERAIATLPPKARRVLVLHDVEGWRHADIAEALGVTVGTSKSQLSRARRLLRERLSP